LKQKLPSLEALQGLGEVGAQVAPVARSKAARQVKKVRPRAAARTATRRRRG